MLAPLDGLKRLGQVRQLRGVAGGERTSKLDAGAQAIGGEASGHALEQRQGLLILAASVKDPREGYSRLGAARLKLDRAPQRLLITRCHQAIDLGGHQRVDEALDLSGRLQANELRDDLAVLERLDRGDPLAAPRRHRSLQQRPELPTGPAPLGPKVDDHRHRMRALDHILLEAGFGHIHAPDGSRRQAILREQPASAIPAVPAPGGRGARSQPRRPRVAGDRRSRHRSRPARGVKTTCMAERLISRGVVRLAVEVQGEGLPVVLLHGLTATRSYVVMGSRLLERSGHRVITYDARGHGRSSPAERPDAYEYRDLVGDLEAVMDALGVERAVLAGASMGAHTALALALRAPQRVAALVVITPAYAPDEHDDPARLARWDALAEGLRQGGVEGFVRAYGEPRTAPAYRETVLKVIRQRLALHEHPEAVADALRVVPRSRPFGALEELRAIEMPTLVVASNDAADPGHPQALGERYAQLIPGARLILDQPGHSPIAWQGSQLSRLIAEVAGRASL